MGSPESLIVVPSRRQNRPVANRYLRILIEFFFSLPIRFACPLAKLPGRGLAALPSRRGLGCVQRSRPAQNPTPASTTATTFSLCLTSGLLSLSLSSHSLPPTNFSSLAPSFLSPSLLLSPPFLLAHLDSVHKRLRGVECRKGSFVHQWLRVYLHP